MSTSTKCMPQLIVRFNDLPKFNRRYLALDKRMQRRWFLIEE